MPSRGNQRRAGTGVGNRERKQRKRIADHFGHTSDGSRAGIWGDDVRHRRVFILNQTDGTVSVINAQTNQLDTPLSTITVGTRPVWADLASGLDELVVANEGTGTTQGSVTIVNIPLCSSTALPTNPNCDPANPIDATTFGQVVATIPVGVNPVMVSVLSDYSRAYVANAGNLSLPCGTGTGTTPCSVSVVNLSTNTVTATIPINGHPAYIATTDSTPTARCM